MWWTFAFHQFYCDFVCTLPNGFGPILFHFWQKWAFFVNFPKCIAKSVSRRCDTLFLPFPLSFCFPFSFSTDPFTGRPLPRPHRFGVWTKNWNNATINGIRCEEEKPKITAWLFASVQQQLEAHETDTTTYNSVLSALYILPCVRTNNNERDDDSDGICAPPTRSPRTHQQKWMLALT